MTINRVSKNTGYSRAFAAFLGLAAGFVCSQVYALNLGTFQVDSALDEPLRAVIEINAATQEELDSLEIELGSKEDFTRADIQRLEFLQLLQFDKVQRSGATVIEVTTEVPVKEPFLHFLVSAQWSGGKIVREYTGLLDPPLYSGQTLSSVQTPSVLEAEGTQISSQTSDLTQSEGTSITNPVLSAGTGGGAEYGPTKAGDTLWEIASKLDTGAINSNIFQVMLALLRENPGAFVDNNINRLKTGQILRLSDIASIANIPRQEASTIYQAQLEEWQSYKTKLAGTTEEIKISSDIAGQSGSQNGDQSASQATTLQSTEGISTTAQQGEAASDQDVLKIVQATLDQQGTSDGAGQGEEISNLKQQITTLEETLISKNQENKELAERVRLLEEQIQSAQRIIELESQELAQAQQQAAIAQQSQSSGNTSQSQQANQAQAVATGSNNQAKAEKPKAEKVTRVSNRPTQRSWWQNILDLLFTSWIWMVGVGLGVIVLLVGLMLLMRRRRSLAEFEESILSGGVLDSQTDSTSTAGTSPTDTSFLSDFGMAGMGSMQTDEVDPLAEAEVYLAYGRDEQAEQVLKEAARRSPERNEIKLKLLEIYKQRGDIKSFETTAEELYPAEGQQNTDVWEQVVTMGRELNPNNPLFQVAIQTSPTTASNADTDEVEPTLGLSTDGEELAFDAPFNLDESQAQSTAGDELNIGGDFFTDNQGESGTTTQPFPQPDQQTDIDIQLDRLTGKPEAGEEESSTSVSQTESVSSDSEFEFNLDEGSSELEFDLGLDEDDKQQTSDSSTETISSDDDPASLDLAGVDDEQSSDESDGLLEFEADSIPPQHTWSDPSSDVLPQVEDEPQEISTENSEQASSPQWDEAATKLDLARAYLDMGDKIGARSIIDEVMREGDPAQRDQAAELASRL